MIDFPNNPALNETFTDGNGVTWICLDATVGDVQWARDDSTAVTPPPSGGSGIVIVNVLANTASTMLSEAALTMPSVKWVATVEDDITNSSLMVEILATHQNGVTPEFIIVGIVGVDPGNGGDTYDFNVNIVGANMQLSLHNKDLTNNYTVTTLTINTST